MVFLFPKNMILFFSRKMENDLSQKIRLKCDILFKSPKKGRIFKKIALEYDLPSVIRKDSISFL